MMVVLCPKCHGIDISADCEAKMLYCNDCQEAFAINRDDYIIADVKDVT